MTVRRVDFEVNVCDAELAEEGKGYLKQAVSTRRSSRTCHSQQHSRQEPGNPRNLVFLNYLSVLDWTTVAPGVNDVQNPGDVWGCHRLNDGN